MALVDFHYVPLAPDDLSGEAFVSQTERAFNELGSEVDQANTTAKQALDRANAAEATSHKALDEAEAASSKAQDALDTSGQAVKKADKALKDSATAQKRADEAFDLAAGADGRAGNAGKAAADALKAANQAGGKADEALATAKEADSKAAYALELASESDAYETVEEPVDADECCLYQARLFILDPASAHFPTKLEFPAYCKVELNDLETAATQTVWNAKGAGVWIRTVGIRHKLNNGPDTITVAFAPKSGAPITATLTVAASGDTPTATFAPGEFVRTSLTAVSITGVASCPVAAFMDGTISINGQKIATLAKGQVTFASRSVATQCGILTIAKIAAEAATVRLTVSHAWTDVDEPALTCSPWDRVL